MDGNALDPRYADAIASIESGGKYDTRGPTTKTGDRAYGKYQVMGANVPQWTQEALGTSMTPEAFLADKAAQDKVFDHRFGSYVTKYGNPDDAASAWFSGRPMSQAGNSADVLGTTVPHYVQKFRNALDGSNSPISQAYASTKGTRMASANDDEDGALSASSIVGPGVLSQAGSGGPMPTGIMNNAGQALTGLGSALAGITSPSQAAALAALSAQMQRTKAKAAAWNTPHIDSKTGVVTRSRSDGYTDQVQGVRPPADEDVGTLAYKKKTAEAFAAKNQEIADNATTSQASLANVAPIRAAFANPGVYQGFGGDGVASLKKALSNMPGMDFKGIADADVATAAANKLTLESRALNGGMPGSLSDKDLAFLRDSNVGLGKVPEANQRLLDIYENLHNRRIEMNKDRLDYVKKNNGVLDEGFNTLMQNKWAEQNKARDASIPDTPTSPARANRPPLGSIFK